MMPTLFGRVSARVGVVPIRSNRNAIQIKRAVVVEPSGFLAVGVGATLGAWLRWFLGLQLNALWPLMPLGTLVANLLGGYAIGLVIGVIDRNATLPPEVRLGMVTGFLGGLTTFSTFSAEVVSRLASGELMGGVATIGMHVAGSLVLTALGFLTVRLVYGA